MTDILATHYADISAADGRDKLTGLLKDEGLATFSGVTDRASLLNLAHGLLTLYLHRDSDPDGVTVITSGAEDRQPGFAGFSSAGLHPHTERSGVAEPPRLVMLCCITPAANGGASQLVDGARLYQRRAEESEVRKPEVEVGPVHAAVDLEDLAGDVAGGRCGQEEDRGRHVLRIADPAELDRPLHLAA